MDEQRQQAYLALTKQLLTCRSPEELEPCLAASSDLLDVGLVQSVIEFSNLCEQEGEEQAAHRLNALAKLLAEVLGLQVLTEAQLKARHRLLVQILQVISESEANPEVVYPLLQANLETLDAGFVQVLEHWLQDILSTQDPTVTETMTAILANFSQLISQFPQGDAAVKQTIAQLIQAHI